MATVTAEKARNQFSELVNRAGYGKERIAVTRRGKAVAAVVPIEDMELLEKLEDKIDLEDARKALAEAKKKGTIPWEKIKAELGL
ncbi:MAG TPA: type II toxin-antitoxin system Phd/YefM family antitoxin [Candidatus Avalokitesvara rifleensis]|uniref:type II toxin-antitoxin system Phd/YefM family antitoxin n=1 Tax=Candidatus Avalokitesvara rifleensis TaxID=3367620 RepID=UPI0027128311|nr:type II toxin-antitoxin system Phd/YefM family antitoxin [Candidatus Brocadiales bacterium]